MNKTFAEHYVENSEKDIIDHSEDHIIFEYTKGNDFKILFNDGSTYVISGLYQENTSFYKPNKSIELTLEKDDENQLTILVRDNVGLNKLLDNDDQNTTQRLTFLLDNGTSIVKTKDEKYEQDFTETAMFCEELGINHSDIEIQIKKYNEKNPSLLNFLNNKIKNNNNKKKQDKPKI